MKKYQIINKITGECLPSTSSYTFKFVAEWIFIFAVACGVDHEEYEIR